jgi:hypothetical protein
MSLFSHQLDPNKRMGYERSGTPELDIQFMILTYWLTRIDRLMFKARNAKERDACNNMKDAIRSSNEDSKRIAQITITLKENEFNF